MWSTRFVDNLENWSVDPGLQERRFLARNHLLDQRPSTARIALYEAFGVDGLDNDHDWHVLHTNYLEQHVRRRFSAGLRPVLMRDEAPDTFVLDAQLSPYSQVAHDMELIRVWRIDQLARLSTRSPSEVLVAADNPADMEAVLEDVNDRLDGRPTFASFVEDLAELLPHEESLAPDGWADLLRDALGMWQVSPPPGSSVPIMVFRYRVGDVVRLQGGGSSRPLTIPTVLDIDQHEAFCPAPLSLPVGRLVNLKADLDEVPAGEVLHPATPLSASQVFRIGEVRTPAPSLGPARGVHLTWLQLEAESNCDVSFDRDVMVL